MASKKKKTGTGVGTNPRRKSTEEFIRSAMGSTEREPGWEYGTVLPVRVREGKTGKKEREWGLGYSDTAKGMLEAVTAPRKAMQGKEFTPEEAMQFAMGVTAPGVATARYAPGVVNMPIVYHGTPHKFEPTPDNPLGEFDASKIGTGEGAQMRGHGIYLAEVRDTAQTYKTAGSDTAYKRTSGGMSPMEEYAYDLATQGRTGEDLFSAMYQKYGKTVKTDEDFNAFQAAIDKAETAKGNLYTADLPDEMVDRMMDWDKPLIDQPEIHDSLEKLSDAGAIDLFQGITGGQLLEQMDKAAGYESERVASLLRQAGILGIKYLDQRSRDASQGTRNFVLFPGEEKKAKIIKRD